MGKAAPALLSGVPIIVKPATATAWLTQRMVKDVIDAGVLPPGALSIICGSSAGLMDQLQPMDVVSFTGSADTAVTIRAHAAITRHSVRSNIEADSVNCALLLPGHATDSDAVALLAREVAREMTVKSGQKCTAIRRVLVPKTLYDSVAQAIGAQLAKTTVGNPRNESVRMGSLVSRAQYENVQQGLSQLLAHTSTLHDGRGKTLIDADPTIAACAQPVLLGTQDPDGHALVHDMEVFGPVATLMPYRDLEHGLALAHRGQGSLVCSVYGEDAGARPPLPVIWQPAMGACTSSAPMSPSCIQATATSCPNLSTAARRAGGGAELGGLRALDFYHRKSAIQAAPQVLQALNQSVEA